MTCPRKPWCHGDINYEILLLGKSGFFSGHTRTADSFKAPCGLLGHHDRTRWFTMFV